MDTERIPELDNVYDEIFNRFPYDPWERERYYSLVRKAWDVSKESRVNATKKSDYELVFLSEHKAFSRLQEEKDIDVKTRSLPSYWFDPLDYGDTNLEDLKALLAIEDDWYKANYIVTCDFPADAAFLRTTVERQQTKDGGGTEYIYIQNLDNSRVFQELSEKQEDPSPWSTVFEEPKTSFVMWGIGYHMDTTSLDSFYDNRKKATVVLPVSDERCFQHQLEDAAKETAKFDVIYDLVKATVKTSLQGHIDFNTGSVYGPIQELAEFSLNAPQPGSIFACREQDLSMFGPQPGSFLNSSFVY